MTFLCRAVYNPFIFNLCVSNLFPLSIRAKETFRYTNALKRYVRYGNLAVFSYEDYVRTGLSVRVFDDDWIEETAIRNGLRRSVTSTLVQAYLHAKLFNRKEDNEENLRNNLTCMALTLSQPVTVRKLQVETLGILPSVSKRMLLFQDVRGKKKKYWRHLN